MTNGGHPQGGGAGVQPTPDKKEESQAEKERREEAPGRSTTDMAPRGREVKARE